MMSKLACGGGVRERNLSFRSTMTAGVPFVQSASSILRPESFFLASCRLGAVQVCTLRSRPRDVCLVAHNLATISHFAAKLQPEFKMQELLRHPPIRLMPAGNKSFHDEDFLLHLRFLIRWFNANTLFSIFPVRQYIIS